MEIQKSETYNLLIEEISTTYISAQHQVVKAVNTAMLQTYWQIGKHIVEFEQGGKTKAIYGKGLIQNLAKDLGFLHGKGFSASNLVYMRLFYQKYPIIEKASQQLSWSHYVELLKVSDDLERKFYEKQSILENWSIPELKRQKKSQLFLRLAASTDKEGILALSEKGKIIEKPIDLLREPYVLEFLKIPAPYRFSEKELEQRILDHLQQFLLELGKGFAFIGRQYRITLGNRHHYVDLVFYHRILKCFVLIDLKKEEATYSDVGQMNMYLGYFEKEENTEGDNPPIGIVLAQNKDDLLIEYAMHNISSQLFVSKYQLYLPNREELLALIARTIEQENE